jgi:lipopolysaccharide transport system ATP-binding protein
MSDTLVKVEKVGKKFCRDLKRSLWYGVQDLGHELFAQKNNKEALRKDEFWAVNDISFEVARGEVLGLIGHNGAGKTTILRMLNGLIKPDLGRISIKGRMQALIALGAGFNPILTGRENVFVNASILGIPEKEIKRRFDKIVEFSGLEEYIDMPVQSYSSGMTVRLGFSIAAHLEPDILLVDEVLAVGDLAFRTKCQVRIQEMRKKGVAIIFVSHNLHALSHTCSRSITIRNGRIIYDGDTEEAINVYRSYLIDNYKEMQNDLQVGTGEIKISGVEVLDLSNEGKKDFHLQDYLKIRLHYYTNQPVNNPVFNVTINVLYGEQVTGFRTDTDGISSGPIEGEGYVDIVIPDLNLLPNNYSIDAILFHNDGFTFYDRVNKAAYFRVLGGLDINGIAFLPHDWKMINKNGDSIYDRDSNRLLISGKRL